MRAAVLTAHGGRDVLRVVNDLPEPQPKHGEIKVQMRAVALNRLDLFVRQGWKGLDLQMPHVTVADGAGVVAAVGDGVTGFTIGDHVCIDPTSVTLECFDSMAGRENLCDDAAILGEHVPGVAAEFVCLPVRNLMKMPESYSFTDAAAAGL